MFSTEQHKRWTITAICLSIAITVFSEVPILEPVLSGNPTGIAPLYFGPNALPVPDMLDGRTQSQLRIEVAGDGYFGHAKDQTADIFARLSIPLFTDRVNLTVWMPVMEWYKMTEQRRQQCRVNDSVPLTGHEAGDVYVSTDIQILKQRCFRPDIAIRAGIKTASGGGFGKARYYDDPGYFFDASIGKSLYITHDRQASGEPADHPLLEMRLSGSAGFLCWQTDNGRQNDAVMYGVQLAVKHEYVSLTATYGGYAGWENHGDRPMTLKFQLNGHIKGFEPYVRYQYGIKDYPFHQLRVGLAYNIDILKKK